MSPRKPTVSFYLSEADLCKQFGINRVSSARWIGEKGNRKMVVRGER